MIEVCQTPDQAVEHLAGSHTDLIFAAHAIRTKFNLTHEATAALLAPHSAQ